MNNEQPKFNKVKAAFDKGYRVGPMGGVSNINTGRAIKLRINTKGYFYFGIRKPSTRTSASVCVHRLQAFQKFGDRIFERGLVVRHLDGNYKNNSPENLELGTHSQNMMDKPAEQRLAMAIHAASFNTKHDHAVIRAYYNEHGWTATLKRFNLTSKGTLSFILNNSRAASIAA